MMGRVVAGEIGMVTNERMRLHGKKVNTRFYIIKNKTVLTILTRAVFLTLTLFSAGVIITSIWLMMDCRQSFATVRPLLPRSAQFCTNMGMPALFACCTMLFAIFGLGCTGRRLTGYALVIISSVEILQSVTALTFYKCNTLSHQEVVGSVNSSLLPCYSPGQATPLFVSLATNNNAKLFPETIYMTHFHRRGRTAKKLSSMPWSSDSSSTFHSDKNSVRRSRVHARHIVKPQQGETRLLLDAAYPSLSMAAPPVTFSRNKIRSVTQNAERSEVYSVQCAADSRYFVTLSQSLKQKDVNICLQACHAYKAVCVTPHEHHSQDTGVPANNGLARGSQILKQNRLSDLGVTEGNMARKAWSPGRHSADGGGVVRSPDRHRDSVEYRVEECGFRVFKFVGDLCYYDNKIILPLSLCAPLLCIALSACFIYLAYCDRILKQEPQAEIFLQHSSSSTHSDKSRLVKIQESFQNMKEYFRTKLCHLRDGCRWKQFVCCSTCTSTPGQLSCEFSNSTQELLNLHAIPSSLALGSTPMSPAASQYMIVSGEGVCIPARQS